MIRFTVRALGLWLLAAAFAAAMIDGMKSIAASKPIIGSTLATWTDLAPGALAAFEAWLDRAAGPTTHAFVVEALGLAPAWALFGVLGAGLIAVALPRKDDAVTPH
ncbi:MAG: hypothetical protein LWW93_16050 [Hyphomicrobiales bacterium]|nr:hypothetical protein [Hyphomicrobiales bacterium]